MALSMLSYRNKTYQISYEILNNNQEKNILILHGWGANKELMKQAFSKTLKQFNQIYIDLPGFGNSNICEILNSEDYAKIIELFLHNKKLQIDIFMGHSFGGKICTLLLQKKFTNATLILLSSAGIVVQKPLKIRLKIIVFKALKKIGLGKFYRFFASKDGSNLSPLMYETFKKVVDENFNTFFSKIQNKTLIFWGKNDTATPLKSGEKIHELIKNSKFFALEGDHFFFLKQNQTIEQIIRKEYDK